LLEQPFIKDQTISISQLIAAKVGKLGENIAVRRFARFKVGDATATVAFVPAKSDGGSDAGPDAGEAPVPAAK
jgi:elongation factor Ts